MRKIPISGKSSLGYFRNLACIVTDLWAYLWTDTSVAVDYLSDLQPFSGILGWLSDCTDRNEGMFFRLIAVMIAALFLLAIGYVVALFVTVTQAIWTTALVIVGLRHFVPADEMIKAEMEKLQR